MEKSPWGDTLEEPYDLFKVKAEEKKPKTEEETDAQVARIAKKLTERATALGAPEVTDTIVPQVSTEKRLGGLVKREKTTLQTSESQSPFADYGVEHSLTVDDKGKVESLYSSDSKRPDSIGLSSKYIKQTVGEGGAMQIAENSMHPEGEDSDQEPATFALDQPVDTQTKRNYAANTLGNLRNELAATENKRKVKFEGDRWDF